MHHHKRKVNRVGQVLNLQGLLQPLACAGADRIVSDSAMILASCKWQGDLRAIPLQFRTLANLTPVLGCQQIWRDFAQLAQVVETIGAPSLLKPLGFANFRLRRGLGCVIQSRVDLGACRITRWNRCFFIGC